MLSAKTFYLYKQIAPPLLATHYSKHVFSSLTTLVNTSFKTSGSLVNYLMLNDFYSRNNQVFVSQSRSSGVTTRCNFSLNRVTDCPNRLVCMHFTHFINCVSSLCMYVCLCGSYLQAAAAATVVMF